MNIETDLYKSEVNTNRTSSGKAVIITKDCVVNGKSYCLTQIYSESAPMEYNLAGYVTHDTYDLHKLKRLHDSIVNDWDSYHVEQIGI